MPRSRIPCAVPILALALTGLAATAQAGEADVLAATLEAAGDGTWRVTATVRHADTGWDHYADAFEVLAPDGTVLGTRILVHPHVEEQPFTRSLSGLVLPDGIATVTVRARDSVHGTGGAAVTLTVPR